MTHSTFFKGIKKELAKGLTTNGAESYNSTLSKVVDLFGKIGNYRYELDKGKDKQAVNEVLSLFKNAYDENKELAIKTMFYARDCRGGMGEKEVFKQFAIAILNSKDSTVTPIILKNLDKIVEYGSWKDIVDIALGIDYKCEELYKFIYNQLENDNENLLVILNNVQSNRPSKISLLAKWLPTSNSRSIHTRKKAIKIANGLGWNIIEYKTLIRDLRKALKIVETKICKEEFDKIDYSQVPSLCMLKNYRLFKTKDQEHFDSYLESVKKGETKINTSVTTPFDVVDKYTDGEDSPKAYDETLEQIWNNLKDVVTKPINAMPLIDTSGSMCGTPMTVAISLGIYLAQHNKTKEYWGKIIEFSDRPSFIQLNKKDSLRDCIGKFRGNVANTNLQAVFDLILKVAVDNELKQEDLPTHLVIVSDMQFDVANGSGWYVNDKELSKKHYGLMKKIRQFYKKYGYEVPQIIYWNVNTGVMAFPETQREGVAFVSGYSQEVFKGVMELDVLEPLDLVKKTLLIDRYNGIEWNFDK